MRYGMQFRSHIVCIDFESEMIAAVQEVLDNARIRGCLFHFSQALWRKMQDLGLTVRYKEDQTFNRLVLRAAALLLVPPNQVHHVWCDVFEVLKAWSDSPCMWMFNAEMRSRPTTTGNSAFTMYRMAVQLVSLYCTSAMKVPSND